MDSLSARSWKRIATRWARGRPGRALDRDRSSEQNEGDQFLPVDLHVQNHAKLLHHLAVVEHLGFVDQHHGLLALLEEFRSRCDN
jgi:hypothetical protein